MESAQRSGPDDQTELVLWIQTNTTVLRSHTSEPILTKASVDGDTPVTLSAPKTTNRFNCRYLNGFDDVTIAIKHDLDRRMSAAVNDRRSSCFRSLKSGDRTSLARIGPAVIVKSQRHLAIA